MPTYLFVVTSYDGRVTWISESGEWNTGPFSPDKTVRVPDSQEPAKVNLVLSWFSLLVCLLKMGVELVLLSRGVMRYKAAYCHSDLFLRGACPQTSAGWVHANVLTNTPILVSTLKDQRNFFYVDTRRREKKLSFQVPLHQNEKPFQVPL